MNSMEENKGTGAGGSNTNKNGLPYEEFTDLKSNTIHIMDNVISAWIETNIFDIFVIGYMSPYPNKHEVIIEKYKLSKYRCK